MSGSFLDSNLLIYLATGDAAPAERVEELLRAGVVISVQVLNETAHVLRRKAGFSWEEVRSFLGLIQSLAQVVPLTADTRRRTAPRRALSSLPL